MGETKIYNIKPCPKPRMTRSDKWRKRACVLRYFDFCDKVREAGVDLPESGASIIFTLPMPKSWTKAKREKMMGKPHQQTPDLDNLVKALSDAVHTEDKQIWNYGSLTKVWGLVGFITITSNEVGGNYEKEN